MLVRAAQKNLVEQIKNEIKEHEVEQMWHESRKCLTEEGMRTDYRLDEDWEQVGVGGATQREQIGLNEEQHRGNKNLLESQNNSYHKTQKILTN